jgi:hypothetical protein
MNQLVTFRRANDLDIQPTWMTILRPLSFITSLVEPQLKSSIFQKE